MRRLVFHMRDRRPMWSMPDTIPGRIQEALGPGWELSAPDVPADGSGDGASTLSPEISTALADSEIYLGFGIPPDVLAAGPGLRWVHSGAAGVGGSLHPTMRSSDVQFTNSAGIHGPPMAETVVAMALYFARGLDLAARSQANARWGADAVLAADSPVREVAGSTALVVGYGGVGREVGSRLAALGARVIGVRRTLPNQGPSEHNVVGADALHSVLPNADLLVLTVPGTGETQHLVGASELALLPRGSVLINVARGPVVNEPALIQALRSGHLRGAALDVFEEEPLPGASELWRLPNVLITPHVSAVGRGFWDRQIRLIEQNISRYLHGRPLLNLVDKEAGY